MHCNFVHIVIFLNCEITTNGAGIFILGWGDKYGHIVSIFFFRSFELLNYRRLLLLVKSKFKAGITIRGVLD